MEPQNRQVHYEKEVFTVAKSAGKKRNMTLYETILHLRDTDECCRFFDDLCTPNELRSMEQRFQAAIYLQQGMVYSEILARTGVSSATVSRVRRSMLDHGAGGVMENVIFREILSRGNPDDTTASDDDTDDDTTDNGNDTADDDNTDSHDTTDNDTADSGDNAK